MGKNYVESSLKRFLKRKAKITLSFITAFMITGSVTFSVAIKENDLINNTYTNNSIIESLGVNIEDVGYEKINIINNGEISRIGNGYYSSAFTVSSPYQVCCIAGDITNNGIIKSYSEKLSINGFFNGNGIGADNAYSYIELGNIKNNGIIFGEVGNSDVSITRSGNGIFLALRNPDYDFKNAYIKLGNVTNSGIIKGKAGANTHESQILGNGIGFFIANDDHRGDEKVGDSSIGDITNSGVISGIIERTFISNGNNAKTTLTGNGIGVSIGYEYTNTGTISGNISIENIQNTGIIKGEHKQIVSYFGNDSAVVSGNGIGVITLGFSDYGDYGNFNLKGITNKGVISGNVNNLETYGMVVGNGLGFYGKNVKLTSDIYNEGVISGKIQNSQESITTSGNGIGITSVYGNVELNNIKNTGFINSIMGNAQGTNVGNGLGIYGKNVQINSIENDGKIKSSFSKTNNKELKGHGIMIKSKDNSLNIFSVKNNGIIIGENTGLNVSKNNTAGELNNYSNGGIIAGKIPVYAQGFTDNMVKSADKGIAVKLDDNGNIESIINGTGGELNGKTVINADITDKDSFISVDKETSYADNIINGAGINSGTLNINAETNIKNSIVNALGTAVNINGNNKFTASNTVLNGGGLDGNTAVITDKENSDISLNKSIINGNIVLGNGNSSLTLSDSQLNGNISGGDGKDNLVIGGLNIFHNIDGFENITFKGSTTLYETSKTAGADKIEIDSGAEVNLRIDSSKKSEDGTYKKHALFNSGNKQLILSGNTNAVTENDVDENGQFIVEENIDKINYNKVSILNIITNGLGINAKIDLGNTKVEDNLWVKTDSILNQAVKSENENGTILTVEAEKDLFTIIKKFENPNPGTPLIPLEPSKPINPGTPLIPLEPSKPVKPETPDMPNKYEKLYVKLNEVYKGIHTSNDRNFNALNDIIINYTFGDKDKTDYPAVGNEKMQMAALLGYLRSVYAETPYSFSNESTRKSMELFHDTVRDNNFKAEKDKWLIYGGLVHQNGDQEQTYYGRNYHGFDTGTADTDAEIKLTGAYGQFEYGHTDTFSTGIIAGGIKSDVEVSSSDLKGTGAYAGIYAKKDIKNLRITAGAGYQYTEYESGRKTINETYSEDYKDKAFNLYLDGKYSYDLGNNLYFVPKAGLSYTHIDQDSIKENNDKALALNIDSKDFNVLEGTAGADIKKIIPSEKGKHSISAGVSYRYIFDGADADYLTADFGGNDFEILVPHKNKGQMSIGVRYEAELENGMFYDVKGNYFMNTDSKENINKNADRGEWRVGAGIGYKFVSIKDLF